MSIMGVKSRHTLRINSRCPWRHREGVRNVYNTAIRRALSPSHPCGRVTVGVHGEPRGVVLSQSSIFGAKSKNWVSGIQ
jgi:hypothetical protein